MTDDEIAAIRKKCAAHHICKPEDVERLLNELTEARAECLQLRFINEAIDEANKRIGEREMRDRAEAKTREYAEQNRKEAAEQKRKAARLGVDPFGHGDMAEFASVELEAAANEAAAIAEMISALPLTGDKT